MKKSLRMLALVLSLLLSLSMLFVSCDKNDEEPQGTPEATTENNKNNNVDDDDDNSGSSKSSEEEKYNKACLLITEGKNEEAYKLLNEIKTYAPAQEKLKNFFYAPQTVIEKWKYSDSAEKTSSNSYTYDAMGNIIVNSDSYGDSDSYTYDENGNWLTRTDMASKDNYSMCTHTYDGNGKLIKSQS